MATVTISYGRFQDPVTFASEAAYEADKRIRDTKARIGSIEYELKKERKRLANPNYPVEYKAETKEIIERLEAELPKVQAARDQAIAEFYAAGGVL